MRREKIAAVLLTGLLAVCVCACGDSSGKPESEVSLAEEKMQDSSGQEASGTEASVLENPVSEDLGSAQQDSFDGEKDWYQAMLDASVISAGTNGRLEKVLNRLKEGGDAAVAFVGGSVTEGALAASYRESYADRFVENLRERYPDSQIEYINAGLSGTGSALGVMRYDRDVTKNGEVLPDIVFLEFAINDYQEPTKGRAYESMVRTILSAENEPAVVLLFSVTRSQWNLQVNYVPLGRLYGLPMVSIKDGIKKPYEEGLIAEKDFFADEYHPTSYGHGIMADCLKKLVEQAEGGAADLSFTLPAQHVNAPDFTNLHLVTSAGDENVILAAGGFGEKDTALQAFGRTKTLSFPDNWMHTKESGSEAFRAELECRNLLLNYKASSSKDFGTAEVYVDGEKVCELNGYDEGGWNNSVQALVLDEKESSRHVLEIRMTEGDEEKNFTLLAFAYSTFEPEGLRKVYEDDFPIGVALPNTVFQGAAKYEDLIINNFNSITCENEMKPDALLDKSKSHDNLEETYLHAAVHFDSCRQAVDFAVKHNLKIRFHTLVWHSQTPRWFFTEDYTDKGELVSREVMLKRMENYIADVLGYFEENYPGLIYAVDVVNEAFDYGNGDENAVRMKDNCWYDTVGADYYYQAFVFARKYASEDMKLFYNDYGCVGKQDLILERLSQAKEEGLIDGIGMQSHLSTSDKLQYEFMYAVKKFCRAGYEVQSTELDIGVTEKTEAAFQAQGRKYRVFFGCMQQLREEGYPITGITVWGLSDKLSWRAKEYPLLFEEDLSEKPAYLGAMQDPSVLNME